SEHRSGDLVQVTLAAAGVGPGPDANGADLLQGPLRADVLYAHEKEDAADEAECMLQHEPLHLPVATAAPVGTHQERPADLDLTAVLVVPVEPRRADDPPAVPIDGDQGAASRQGLVEELPEDERFMAIPCWMLLPDERIGSHRVQLVIVLGTQRAELDEL